MDSKLTDLLKGRTINGTSQSGGTMTISFTDASKLALKTAPSNSNSASTGGTIESASLESDPPVLHVKIQGSDSAVKIPLASSQSVIELKNKDGETEYSN